jgi:hypothetical protein
MEEAQEDNQNTEPLNLNVSSDTQSRKRKAVEDLVEDEVVQGSLDEDFNKCNTTFQQLTKAYQARGYVKC